MIVDERKIAKRAIEIHRMIQRRAPKDARYVNVFIRSSDTHVIALRDGHPSVEEMEANETRVGRFGVNSTVQAIQNAIEYAMEEVEASLLARALPRGETEQHPNEKPNNGDFS